MQQPAPDEYVICLGANSPDAACRLACAAEEIAAYGTVTKASECYRTAPEYSGEKDPYLNRVIFLRSGLDVAALQTALKAYETRVRAENTYPGYVNLDIDIVMHGTDILRPRDHAANYFKIGLQSL